MRLTARHNLTDAELVKALSGLAASEGIAGQLGQALLKAACDCGPREPRDPAVRHLLEQFRDLYRKARRDLLETIAGIVHGDVKKAIGSDPLTKEQLRRIQQAIRDRFEFIAAQMQDDYQPPVELLRRWQERRWVAGNVTAKDFALSVRPEDRLIHNAFVFGRLHQAVEAGGSYEEILKLALGMPLKKPDAHAIAVAEQQAASYITALGDDLAKDAAGIIARRNRLAIHNMVLDTLGQKLPAKILDAEAKQALGIQTREKTVDFWTELKSELHHAMEDKSRDWDRVAYSELHDAKGQGQAMQLLEEFGDRTIVYKMPLPTACPQCKHLYLTADGTPRLFHLPDMMGWGNNIGRKPHQVRGGKVIPGGGRADGAEGLKAVAGQVHPFCQCLGPYPFSGVEPWAEQAIHNMGKEPLAKAHIKQYTRADGTLVKEHDDSRQAKGEHHAAGYEAAAMHGKSRGHASAQEAYRKYLRKKGGVPMAARDEFVAGYLQRIEGKAEGKATDRPTFPGPKPELQYDPSAEEIQKHLPERLPEGIYSIYAQERTLKYKTKTMAVADLTPTQHGEDRINDSSKETAKILREWNAGKQSRDSIEYIGDFMPIVVDEKGTIIDGNHRYTAHQMNQWKYIRVMQVAGEWEYNVNGGWKRSKDVKKSIASLLLTPEEDKAFVLKLQVSRPGDQFNLGQFMQGMKVEMEHADITGGDPLLTAKIVAAHLREREDYYTALAKIEKACPRGYLLRKRR